MAFGAVPVAWSTWLTRTVPDEAESAGGLLVAAVQVAITVGAAGGGAIYDFKGATAVFGACSVVLVARCVLALFVVPTRAERPPEDKAGGGRAASSADANSFSPRHRRYGPVRLPAASSRLECPGANAIKEVDDVLETVTRDALGDEDNP